ncbi:hypothetical protein P9133_31990 [Bacillus thuringiensis]|uniref:Uncharacterized protein n=1 Tax=Bacillus thuringiensis HD-771 TaxID=1218175 RepID=A0A9W3J5N6_BACTU|nr:hypothetical protein [Bacillus thuringiensis]AFQ14638.1 hypothetical protein BTG_05730 [Bacillus thuringiensis HD-771]MEC3268940.1 hypothetical protein [Bacillus thuringiensis]MEC3515442.1 hypothetical protein [Bacillus thuringiensis]MED2072299.1 hypothetical protein [Bacillus thuringiensis]MED2223634.1 hypothetical protein [Bacillus thuringiensis]
MAKTYKTERGLKTALKKVLGEESKASENGTMSKGFLMFPVEKDKKYRVIMIGEDGFPQAYNGESYPDWSCTLEEDFGGEANVAVMFGLNRYFVDIPLEVSK